MKPLALCVLCAAASLRADEQHLEKRILFDSTSAKTWTAEEATMESSAELTKTSGPSLRWRVTVDYHAGEAKYPIGWPRVGHALKADEGDWSGWDYFQMWIHTRTSRKELPRVPAVLNILQGEGKSMPCMRILSELKKDEWIRIQIPLSKLTLPAEVTRIQLNIAEDQYHHQDTLDFHIGEMALLRHTAPALVDFTAANAVLFDDAKQASASFQLLGIQPGERRRVTLQWRREGQIEASGAVDAVRGAQQAALDISRASLKPGGYELTGAVEGGSEQATARMRVVASPWR